MSTEATPAAPAAPVVPPVVSPAVPPAAAAAPAVAPAAPAAPAETSKELETRSRLAMQSMQVLKDKAEIEKAKQTLADERKSVDARAAQFAAAAKEKDIHKALATLGWTPEERAATLLAARSVEDKPADPKMLELQARVEASEKFVEETKERLASEEKARAEAQKQADHAASVQALATELEGEKEKYPLTVGLGITQQVIDKANELVANGKAFSAADAIEQAKPLVEAIAEKDLPTFIDKLVSYPKARAILEAALGKAAPPTAAAAAAPAKVETAALAAAQVAARPPPPKWEVKTAEPARKHVAQAKPMAFGSPEWDAEYAKRKTAGR